MQDVIEALYDAAWDYQLQNRPDRAETCEDIAAKLERYGSFASERQEAFARNLIAWSKPQQAGQQAAHAPLQLPRIAAALEGAKRITVGALTFNRSSRSGDIWFTCSDVLIGKLDGSVLKIFKARAEQAQVDLPAVRTAVLQIEADPRAAVIEHGKRTGICGICGRELTDPASIALGIGPVCAERLG